MEKQVIFFPKTLLDTSEIKVELLGFTKVIKNVRYYFILANYVKDMNTEYKVQKVGHFTKTSCRSCQQQKKTNILCITKIDGNLNASLSPGKNDNFVLVLYDPSRLHDYGALLDNESDSQKFICFTMLSKWLASNKNAAKHDHVPEIKLFRRLTQYLLIVLNVIIKSFETKFVQLTILRLTLIKHIFGVIKNYVWFIENLMDNKRVLSRAKAVNYLMSCICDAFFGITILYLLNTTFTSSNELFSHISSISHVI